VVRGHDLHGHVDDGLGQALESAARRRSSDWNGRGSRFDRAFRCGTARLHGSRTTRSLRAGFSMKSVRAALEASNRDVDGRAGRSS